MAVGGGESLDNALRSELNKEFEVLLDALAVPKLQKSPKQRVVRDRDTARRQNVSSGNIGIVVGGL